MKSRFSLWAFILIFSLVITGLCIRLLATRGVPLSESLVLRGISCLLLVIIFAYKRNLSLWPKSIRTQFFRALLAGFALTLFSMSYNWLTASTVSVLSNIDVPLLIALGPLVGIQASWRSRGLSLVSILFLIWYVSALEVQRNLFLGLASLSIGTLALCFGYLFIKKSMNDENEGITILVPSLAIVFYGILDQFGAGLLSSGQIFETWNLEFILIGILSGCGMFGAYIATMRLYSLTDIATAELPTLLSSIVIQPFEALFLNEALQATYFISSICFVLMIFFIVHYAKGQGVS